MVSADEAIDMLEGLCWHEFQQAQADAHAKEGQ